MVSFTRSKLSARIGAPQAKVKAKKKNKKFSYFMARWLRLDGTRIDGDGATVAASLIILPKVVEKQS